MARAWTARVSSVLQTLPRWLGPAFLFVLSFALHASTLQGGFVWDDRPAVVENRDVWTDSPWGAMWRHDFWGQNMSDAGSHKSFRPLTTLTYRLSNLAAQRYSSEADATSRTSAQESDPDGEPSSRGTAPERRDAEGFHLVNVVVHAATSALSLGLFRGVFAGEELPAVMAALLFTVHPVHVEAVAPIVGRADLLCGLCAMVALTLTVGGGGGGAGGAGGPRVVKKKRQTITSYGTHNGCGKLDDRSAMRPPPPPPITGSAAAAVDIGKSSSRTELVVVVEAHSLEPSLVSFVTTLALAAAATLCKEVGLTVFGLLAGAEIVRFFEARNCRRQEAADVSDISVPGLRKEVRDYSYRFRPVPAAARALSAAICAALLVWLHLILHAGEAIREWGVLENDIAVLPSRTERALSYAYTHAVYAAKLAWPDRLCYDWGYRCIPHVTSLTDPAALASLVLYVAMVGGAAISIARCDTAVMWGLALVVVPFLPASNVFFPIGAVVAERLLYLPSLGACLLAGCMLRRGGDDPNDNNKKSSRPTGGGRLGRGENRCPKKETQKIEQGSIPPPPPPDGKAKAKAKAKNGKASAFSSSTRAPVRGFGGGHGTRFLREKEVEKDAKVAADNINTYRPSTTKVRPPTKVTVLSAPTNTPPLSVTPVDDHRDNNKTNNNNLLSALRTKEAAAAVAATTTAAAVHNQSKDAALDNTPAGMAGSRVQHRREGCNRSTTPASRRCSTPTDNNDDDLAMDYDPNKTRSDKTASIPVALGPNKPTRAPRKKRPSIFLFFCFRPSAVAAATSSVKKVRSLKDTVVLGFLLAWAAFFSGQTARRCGDWKSERTLFESAVRVCPDGIKTLNNLAAGMLNAEEAGLAERLLRRALELHPEFPRALFNLAVALTFRGDHEGAVSALERSHALEPANTKIMVYLGQQHLTLAREALRKRHHEDPSSLARGRGGGDGNVEGSGSSSAEVLLSRAELYTDRALAAGSGLPLARLVKGDILVLRGKHQNATKHFRAGIDISLGLLAGRSAALVGRGVEEGDALHLASTYNSLGLSLRESGSDVIAAKEAFLEGLSIAPEDMALLVNGGVANQNAGDISGAFDLYHRALLLHPTSPELLSNLGWLEEQRGGGSPRESLETAARYYERAMAALEGDDSAARGQIEINLANVRTRLLILGDSGAGGGQGG